MYLKLLKKLKIHTFFQFYIEITYISIFIYSLNAQTFLLGELKICISTITNVTLINIWTHIKVWFQCFKYVGPMLKSKTHAIYVVSPVYQREIFNR